MGNHVQVKIEEHQRSYNSCKISALQNHTIKQHLFVLGCIKLLLIVFNYFL